MLSTRWGLFTLLLLPSAALAVDIQVPSGGSISTALSSAMSGDRVLVEAGTYTENLVIPSGVQLLGGYDASFADSTRDASLNVTTLDGGSANPAVTATGASSATVIDGFHLIRGGGSPGCLVRFSGGAPVFSGNVIEGSRRIGITGGAYVTNGCAARFEGNTFRDNSTGGSGGVIHALDSPIVVVGNTFDANVAQSSGGAIYLFRSAATCTSNTFRNGLAGDGGGGAVFAQQSDGAVFHSNDFEDNRGSHGGALLLRDSDSLELTDNTFHDNSATRPAIGFGGGAAILFSEVTVTNNRFSGCSASGDGGGFFGLDADVTMTGVDATNPSSSAHFDNCTAGGSGGGLKLVGSVGTGTQIRWSGCVAAFRGGGMELEESDFDLTESLFENCSAYDGGGASFYVPNALYTGVSDFKNITVYGCASSGGDTAGGLLFLGNNNHNFATVGACLITHTMAGASLLGSRLTGISPTQGPQPTIRCSTVYQDPSNPDTVAVVGGRVTTAFGVGLNATRDPLYCDTTSYFLQDCSPDVDAITSENCIHGVAGRENRGVTEQTCSCAPRVSVESMSWGEIKAGYR